MSHVFISYSRKDQSIIDRVARELSTATVEVWIDRADIRGGTKWRREIVEAIEGADALVVALSPDSVESEDVRKEIDIAEEMKKEIVPLLIRKTAIPKDMVYQLIGLQHIDLASDFSLGVKRLIEALLLLDARGPTLVLLSPEARIELKRLIADRSSSPSEKMVELVAVWTKELSRVGDLRMAEILALDDRAHKRMALSDYWHQTGNKLDEHLRVREKRKDELRWKQLWEFDDQVKKLGRIVMSQLENLNRSGTALIKDFWGQSP